MKLSETTLQAVGRRLHVTRGLPDLPPGKGGRNVLKARGADRLTMVQEKPR